VTVEITTMVSLIFALAIGAAPGTPPSPMSEDPKIVEGKCDSKSGVTVGHAEQSQFVCDVAVVARSRTGSLVIQFTDKTGLMA